MRSAERHVAREQLRVYGAMAISQAAKEEDRREWVGAVTQAAGWAR